MGTGAILNAIRSPTVRFAAWLRVACVPVAPAPTVATFVVGGSPPPVKMLLNHASRKLLMTCSGPGPPTINTASESMIEVVPVYQQQNPAMYEFATVISVPSTCTPRDALR